MNSQDRGQFAEIVGMLFDVFNQPEPQPRKMKAWWAVLVDYPIEVVEQAAYEYLKTGKYPPKPSDILEAITGAMRDHWPTADEAWANAQAAVDERNTVVWTEEAAQAWFQSAQPLMEAGDKIAARRSFIDTYERLVTESMALGRPPRALISEGHDADLRAAAIRHAESVGMISHDEAAHRLIGTDSVTSEGNAIAGLLTGKDVELPDGSKVKRKIDQIKDVIRTAPDSKQQRRENLQRQREHYERAKRESIDALDKAYGRSDMRRQGAA